MRVKRALLAGAAALALAGGMGAVTATSAHAANPPTVIALPALGTSGANPLGQALNAKGWAGENTGAICNPLSPYYAQGVVNDPIGTWAVNSAGCASSFQILDDPTPGTFQIQFNPNGNTSANLCVSTISNQKGVYSRLRPCAAGGNMWQTFETEPADSDITGGVEIVPAADPSLALNALGYRTNAASQVALWPITTGTNQIWASVEGPGLPL